MSIWPFDHLTPMKYGAILTDYPWPYKMRTSKGYKKSPEAHYQTIPLEKGAKLPVGQLAAPDAYIFMWSTWPHLKIAQDLMEAWDFTYVTGGAWIKRTVNWKLAFGTGYTLHSATEPFLLGKIGRPKITSRSERNAIDAPVEVLDSEILEDPLAIRLDDMIDALRREHSRKPPQMREMIERLLPDVPKCELFAREPWGAHDVWGNQTEKFEES